MRRMNGALLGIILVLGTLAGAGTASAGIEAVQGGIRFTYRDAYAKSVTLAGSFNGWNQTANPMTQEGGVWTIVVALGPGQHEYKFVVDDNWTADPENPVTVGDFGNSAAQVGPDGKLVALKATSNTELSPKIYLGSRYITLFKLRETQDANPSWNLDRPLHDVDLDFTIRMNEVLTAHVLTNINNEAQNVQLWETNLRFDRGSLTLDTGAIRIKAFDNDSLGSFDDPLVLLGNVGIYDHAWGYDQQGISVWKDWKGFRGQLVYSDNFVRGGADFGGGAAPEDLILVTDDGVYPLEAYGFSDTDGAKDVLAGRVKRDLSAGALTLGGSFRVDRGLNPGGYGFARLPAAASQDTVDALVYPDTRERWQAGGLDFRYGDEKAGIDLYGEALLGKSVIDVGNGQITRLAVDDAGNVTTVSVRGAPEDDVTLDTSRRFILGGHYYAYRGWHWRGGFEFEDHDLAPVANDSLRAIYNRVGTWRLDLGFDGDEWMRWPWKAGLGLEYYDFKYPADAPWSSQLWFDYNNFWLEQGEHEITVDRLVMLGGDDVVSWRPRAEWTVNRAHNASVRWNGILNSTKPGRKPKYWENVVALHWEFTKRLALNTDSRWVRYDDPVLKLDDTFLSHFVEMKYRFTPAIEVGLSWGVDPYVIDGVTNEYAPIGRDLYLFGQGANGSAARERYLELGEVIRRAEQQLEDENRFQLEAIVRF